MKKCLPILFLLIFVTPAQAKWVEINSAAKQGVTHYFEPATLLKEGQFVKIWVLSSYDEKQKGGHHAVKTRYEFDVPITKPVRSRCCCIPIKATGVVIGAHHGESQDWFGFSAHSMLRHIAETVCVD